VEGGAGRNVRKPGRESGRCIAPKLAFLRSLLYSSTGSVVKKLLYVSSLSLGVVYSV
jgi:hypothetical protein